MSMQAPVPRNFCVSLDARTAALYMEVTQQLQGDIHKTAAHAIGYFVSLCEGSFSDSDAAEPSTSKSPYVPTKDTPEPNTHFNIRLPRDAAQNFALLMEQIPDDGNYALTRLVRLYLGSYRVVQEDGFNGFVLHGMNPNDVRDAKHWLPPI